MAAVRRPGGGTHGGRGDAGDPVWRLATEENWLQKASTPDSPQHDYLTFLIADEEYGVDIERIREIIKVRAVTEVPHAPAFVMGVIAVRGVVLPVIHLHRRLRLPSPAVSRAARFLIVRRGEEELFGLLVDEVLHVVRLSEADTEPAPPMLSGPEADFVAGVGRARGRMVILLNLDQVLRFDVRRRTLERGGAAAEPGRRSGEEPRG